LQLGPL